jgi:pimeloyl-[acyl-carrier protein] methyl ester esterase
MHGVNDAVIPHAAGEYLARMLPHGEFASVPGAGHAMFVMREAAIAQRIREFHGRH